METELAAVEPATDLREDRRSGRCEPDQGRNRRHEGGQDQQAGGGDGDIGHAFHEQADLVVWSGCECQQRRGFQAVERNGAVDVRKEIHRHAGAHALLVAEKKNVLKLGQALAADGEDNLVHHVLAQERGSSAMGYTLWTAPRRISDGPPPDSLKNPRRRTPYFADSSTTRARRMARSPVPTTMT